ncbi:histidinol phosphatase [Pedobacter frigiditerrae]|uniref:protein-tyrosine-phosphatase n=1 Tax=Pedobacter frigiditerrae TaxID=2530452 RepID=A0A4R0N356_9SPHI|nr:CpsB/CapC family capsule biosynthesis tyrosine phosphatase [Pedobacter frigiditerrae]TCC94200.1 histidinol phosphatase [Pedobacter frigiditerrae]
MLSFFKTKPPLVADLTWLGVDLHSHLLPGLDDGAPDLETSLFLIKKLNELGFSKFICTPHIFKELYPNTPASIGAALATVKESLKKAGSNIKVAAGAEYMIDGDFNMDEPLQLMPDNYILIEMSYLSEAPHIEQTVFDLQIKGYTVILAHPERYNFYHKSLSRYQRFKDMGCLFQLNLLSVTGYYGKEVKLVTDYLLKNKLYDLAATDLHHEKHLKALEHSVKNGELFKQIGNYPFKNQKLFDNNNNFT